MRIYQAYLIKSVDLLSVFSFLNCWAKSIYIWLFLSLIVICLLRGVRVRSFWEALELFWDSLSILLSDSISRVPKQSVDRLLIGLWLLANTVLISIYSGELYNNVISGKVIDKIETNEQLLTKDHWKDSKLIICDNTICDVISCNKEVDPDSIYAKIMDRTDIINTYDLMDSMLRKEVFMSVLTENKVIIANKLSTYYILQ